MADTSKKYVKCVYTEPLLFKPSHRDRVQDALAGYLSGKTPYKRKGRPVGIAGQNKRSRRRATACNNSDRG